VDNTNMENPVVMYTDVTDYPILRFSVSAFTLTICNL